MALSATNPRSVAARLRERVEVAEQDRSVLQRWGSDEAAPDDPRWEGDPATDGLLVEEWDPDEVYAMELEDARRDGLPVDEVRAAQHELAAALGPFWKSEWQVDLARYREGGRTDAQRFLEDAHLLHRLAADVPRTLGDSTGGTPWTSFLREIAVARGMSARAAADQVGQATLLLEEMTQVRSHLHRGLLPVAAARALLEVARTATEAAGCRAVDALSERACLLPAWQVREEALRALLAADADAAAMRAARAARGRHAHTRPVEDEQGEIALVGPAVPVSQAWSALDHDARALKAAGDPRTLDQLRFDLAVHRLLDEHLLEDRAADPGLTAAGAGGPTAPAGDACAGSSIAPAGTACADPACTLTDCAVPRALPAAPGDTSNPRWLLDRRFSRPVQALVTVPVTTARGLADDPAYLAGYGWISAPSARLLLPAAELRQLCTVQAGEPGAGTLLDRSPQVTRPEPDPVAFAAALDAMMSLPFAVTDAAWQQQDQHDPSPDLRALVQQRDQWDDGPLGDRVPAARCDLDHEVPHPEGPTAAWNLGPRSRRTHLLKHLAWLAVRTSLGTTWTSPAGQKVLRPRLDDPVSLPRGARLPDPVALREADLALVTGWPDDDPPF